MICSNTFELSKQTKTNQPSLPEGVNSFAGVFLVEVAYNEFIGELGCCCLRGDRLSLK